MTTTAAEARGPGKRVPMPLVAAMPGGQEWESASNQLLQSWKQQLDTNLKLIDAFVQGTLEMRSSQLAAAMETHDRDMTAEHSVEGARSALDLLAVQMNWMMGNLERSLAYWNQMFQAAVDANAKLVECLREQQKTQGAGGPAQPE